jgi:hypothetical protein
MKKKILLIGCILTVSLLTLVGFSNVVGYQSVKNTQEEIITNSYDFEYCKEYLFETLVEISDNDDVEEILNKNTQHHRNVLSFKKNKADLKDEHLEILYNLGLKIVDRIGEDNVAKIMENREIEKSEYPDEVDAIIIGNDELAERIDTLNEMNGEGASIAGFEDTPIICAILAIIVLPVYMLGIIAYMGGWVFPALQLARIIFQIIFFVLVPIMVILFPFYLVGSVLGCWR